MKVTGYKLREALKAWELRRKMAGDSFDKLLHAFEDEKKESPREVMKRFTSADAAIAILQIAQARYNLTLTVNVLDKTMTLCTAVKLVGGASREEKLWRTAAIEAKDPYSSLARDLVRNSDQERASKTISTQEAGKFVTESSKYAGALRAAIAMANSKELELEDLSPDLFE